MWGTRLDRSVILSEFFAALERHDFTLAPGGIPGRLVVYDHAGSGHRIVFVPHTRRIQIRLDALTQHEDRPGVAQRVYNILHLATAEALQRSAHHRDAAGDITDTNNIDRDGRDVGPNGSEVMTTSCL